MRCKRCGHQPDDTAKFCAECGLLLKDPHIDDRILLAFASARDGNRLFAVLVTLLQDAARGGR